MDFSYGESDEESPYDHGLYHGVLSGKRNIEAHMAGRKDLEIDQDDVEDGDDGGEHSPESVFVLAGSTARFLP